MSTLRVDNFAPSGGGTPFTIEGIAKSRIKFNGTGTVAIEGSMNISSLVDVGTGDYDIIFTNPFVNANYSVATAHQIPSGTSDQRVSDMFTTGHNSLHSTSSGAADANPVSASSFGDLA
jgi:hypothetical protein